jgi:hypothetical protein
VNVTNLLFVQVTQMENESLPPSVIPFEIVIKPTYNMNNDIGASTIDHKT